jgi:hypothetical protein
MALMPDPRIPAKWRAEKFVPSIDKDKRFPWASGWMKADDSPYPGSACQVKSLNLKDAKIRMGKMGRVRHVRGRAGFRQPKQALSSSWPRGI